MDQTTYQVTNRTGCLAKGVAYSGQIGQDLLRLAKQAHAAGKIGEEDWQKLPGTPEGMAKLILSENVEKQLIEALLETYSSIRKGNGR
jgi:hypothetical protein